MIAEYHRTHGESQVEFDQQEIVRKPAVSMKRQHRQHQCVKLLLSAMLSPSTHGHLTTRVQLVDLLACGSQTGRLPHVRGQRARGAWQASGKGIVFFAVPLAASDLSAQRQLA